MKQKEIHLLAQIKVLPFEESGRTIGNNICIDKYFPWFKYDNKLNDVFLYHTTKTHLQSKEETEIGISFKFPISRIGNFSTKNEFELTEGRRTIIKGRIIKILNPILDRSLINQNQSKTIEQLENDFWVQPKIHSSKMIEKCYNLRQKPISELSAEDLRLLFSQDIGLPFIALTVISKLLKNESIECDYYPGDLLQATFRKLNSDWGISNSLKDELISVIRNRFPSIKKKDEIPEKVKREIFDLMVDFENQ